MNFVDALSNGEDANHENNENNDNNDNLKLSPNLKTG